MEQRTLTKQTGTNAHHMHPSCTKYRTSMSQLLPVLLLAQLHSLQRMFGLLGE